MMQVIHIRSRQQRWADCHILRSRSSREFSKLSPGPTTVQTCFEIKNSSPNKLQKIKKNTFLIKYIMHFFSINSVQIRVLIVHLWSNFQSGSNPDSTKFGIVRIHCNPSPVQCSSLADRCILLNHLGATEGKRTTIHVNGGMSICFVVFSGWEKSRNSLRVSTISLWLQSTD